MSRPGISAKIQTLTTLRKPIAMVQQCVTGEVTLKVMYLVLQFMQLGNASGFWDNEIDFLGWPVNLQSIHNTF